MERRSGCQRPYLLPAKTVSGTGGAWSLDEWEHWAWPAHGVVGLSAHAGQVG